MKIVIILSIAAATFPILADTISFKPPVELSDHGMVAGDYWVDVDGNGIPDRTGFDGGRRELISLLRFSRAHSPYKTVSHGSVTNFLSGPWLRDIDGDGDEDFVIQEGRELIWWESRSGEGLFRREALATVGVNELIFAYDDLDGDGLMDLVLRELRFSGGFPDSGSPMIPRIGYGNAQADFDWVNYTELEDRFIYYTSPGTAKVSSEGHLFWGDPSLSVVQIGRELADVKIEYRRGSFVDLNGDGVMELVETDQYYDFNNYSKTVINEVVVYRWHLEGKQEIDRLTFNPFYQYDELLFPRIDPGEPPVIFLWSNRAFQGYGPTYSLEGGSLTGGIEAGDYAVAPDYGNFNKEREYDYYLLDDDGDGMDSVVSSSNEVGRDIFGLPRAYLPIRGDSSESERMEEFSSIRDQKSRPSSDP